MTAAAITDRKIRFGVVGCGRISANHFEALKQHAERAELVGICDNDATVLARTAEKTGARAYSSLKAMVAAAEVDVVVLCTPSGLHPEQAIESARHGKHVVTEKPMATRWVDGINMVKACDHAGVRLFVVKQNRRNATLRLVKRALEQRRFGRVFMATINVFWCRPQAYIATLARNIQVEDTATVGIRWRSGCLGSVNVTMLAYAKNFEGSLTILGEQGTVRVGGVAVNEIQHWEFAAAHPDDDEVRSASYSTTSVYGFGHSTYYDNVIQTLRGEAEPETDGREGLRSLEVLIASYLSARDGRRVALPLEY